MKLNDATETMQDLKDLFAKFSVVTNKIKELQKSALNDRIAIGRKEANDGIVGQLDCGSIANVIDHGCVPYETEYAPSGNDGIQQQLMNEPDCGSIVNDSNHGCVPYATEYAPSGNDGIQKPLLLNVPDCVSIANVIDHGCVPYATEYAPSENDGIQKPLLLNVPDCVSIANVIDHGCLPYETEYALSGNDVIRKPLMNDTDCGSIANVIDDGCVAFNVLGLHVQKTADSNENLSQLDLCQMEFISEDEVCALERFEVLMEIDLTLENPLHVLPSVHIPTYRPSSVSEAQVEFQTNIRSKSLYENFMFGYDDDDIEDKATDSKESLPISPARLLTNVNPGQRSCDNKGMVVPTSNESKQSKRLFCTFCKKNVSKLARHLLSVHKKKKEVERLINLPKELKKRRLAGLAKLKNRGMCEHNADRKYNKNVFLTCRRPNISRPRDACDFTTCAKCLGTYSKKSIRAHFKRCAAIDVDINGERSVLVLGRLVEGRVHEDACDMLKDVISHMTEDDVVRLVRYDWLVIAYCNGLCDSNVEVFQSVVISGKFRLAGRLLKILKSIEPEIMDFSSLYRPKYYNNVIQAIRAIGKFDPIKKYYGAPSTSKAAVLLVRAVGVKLVSEYIQKEDVESQTRTENFNKLFNCGVTTSVSKGVYRTQAQMKRDKRERLPTTEDIKLLAAYIKKELKTSVEKLSEKYSYGLYLNLARMTVASIIVFNRRRTGETQNILTKDYHRREYLENKLLATLSVDDQKMAKQYSRMKIRGKLNRTVPCLIKPDVDKSIQLLIHHRMNAKIPNDNEFLFGLPPTVTGRIRRINACNVLRKISLLCGAKEPELLRGTKMRKHVASMCISLELTESAVSEVAEFMGHHDKVHYDYYRKMPTVREVVKMSKLLRTAQGDDEDEDEDGEISEDEDQNDPDGDTEEWSAAVESVETVTGSEENIEDLRDKDGAVGSIVQAAEYAEASDGRNKINKGRWSLEEIAAGKKLFSADMKVPSLAAIDEQRDEVLKNRTTQQIKAWMYHQNKKSPTIA